MDFPPCMTVNGVRIYKQMKRINIFKARMWQKIQILSEVSFQEYGFFSPSKLLTVSEFKQWKEWSSCCNNNNDRNCSFKYWLSYMDCAVGGLTHKQLAQIRYHLKAETSAFKLWRRKNILKGFWDTDEWKALFELVEE